MGRAGGVSAGLAGVLACSRACLEGLTASLLPFQPRDLHQLAAHWLGKLARFGQHHPHTSHFHASIITILMSVTPSREHTSLN